jgi:TolA-binding protein
MTHSRSLTLGGILIAGAFAFAQTPPPPPPAPAPVAAPMAAPAPPAPPAAPTPTPAPAAVAAPFAYVGDLDFDQVITPEVQMRLDEARERIRDMRLNLNIDVQDQIEAARAGAEAARASAEAVRESLRTVAPAIASAARAGVGYGLGVGQGFAFAPQIAPPPPAPPTPPAALRGRIFMNMSTDRAYSAGQSALDSRRWEDAITYFGQVISRGTTRVDGALYWKAYAQAKLGRRDDALATIAELRKSYSASKWLDEAKALEVEVNQGVKPMSAEAETDEDIKVLILQQGIQTDFDRFYPALEKIIQGSASPKLKRNALYVLADSSNPKAQALIEQVARGGGNPDLQVKAIQYMTERRRGNTNTNTAQILGEIYNSTNDAEVKREIIQGLIRLKDKDRLVNILKTEKNSDLRRSAISYFGEQPGNAELWQLYASETTPEGKVMILEHAYRNGNSDKLLEVIRNEKDTKIRVAGIRALGSYPGAADSLVTVYGSEQDPQVKQAIIDAIYSQRANGKAMVELARAEKDQKMKFRMLERMSGRKDCKECQDYLLEILNK